MVPHASDTDDELVRNAQQVLRLNDMGSTTIPAAGIYPHQWNWDSALIALGWGTIDSSRAWTELEALAGMRTSTGMISHIAFAHDPGAYFPGPDWWGELHSVDGRRVSGITQPPVAATCLRLLLQRFPDEQRARQLLTPLFAWHEWLLTVRDPDKLGEPLIVHPWESGRDNAPEWDEALDRLGEAHQPFQRADTGFVDEAQRPTKAHYSKYIRLVEVFRAENWRHEQIARTSPFRMLDPGFSAILAAACNDLAAVALELGEDRIAEQSMAHAMMVGNALKARCDANGMVWPIDLERDSEVHVVSCGSALAALAPGLPMSAVDSIAELVTTGELAAASGVRSSSATTHHGSDTNYWRGPVWTNVTWLVQLALARRGLDAQSQELREKMISLFTNVGAREYASPDGQRGLGAQDFSWTAALVLWELDADGGSNTD